MSNPNVTSQLVLRQVTIGGPIPCEHFSAMDADVVVLTRFFSRLVNQLSEGTTEIDVEAVWDDLVALGLGERVAYDPAIHGECEAEEGDMIYVYTAQGRTLTERGAALDAEAETLRPGP